MIKDTALVVRKIYSNNTFLCQLPEERKLDLLKNLAESSPYSAPQDSRQILPSVVQLLKVHIVMVLSTQCNIPFFECLVYGTSNRSGYVLIDNKNTSVMPISIHTFLIKCFPFFHQKYMPRRKTGEETNFTYVECLLYTFHHLAYKVIDPLWFYLRHILLPGSVLLNIVGSCCTGPKCHK